MNELEKMLLDGKTLKESLPKVPRNTLENLYEGLRSKYDLISLGFREEEDQDIEVTLAEEDRYNFHIIGEPRQGKSKLLELLLRYDIDNGFGACLLDASENAETMYAVLKYCIAIGYEKVVVIDPRHISLEDKYANVRCVPTINPLHYSRDATSATAAKVSDVLRETWGQKNFQSTPRIKKYIPAVIRALLAARLTLSEIRYFTSKFYLPEVKNILWHLAPDDENKAILTAAFTNQREWDGFLPTVNHFLPLVDERMRLILGSNQFREGKPTQIDFKRLIADGWLILVNLYPTGIWDIDQQKVLGAIILSEITNAVSRLRSTDKKDNEWQGKFYCYVDEAFLFATPNLADQIVTKPKTGLRFILAHHYLGQFDKELVTSISNGTPVKFMFHCDEETRRSMIKNLGYGGELKDDDVVYNLQHLKKQECVFKNNKLPPVKMRLSDIETPDVSPKEIQDFLKNIYARHPFYKSVAEVRAETQNRFARSNPQPNIKHPSPNVKRQEESTPASSRTRTKTNSNPTGEVLPFGQDRAALESLLSKRRSRRAGSPGTGVESGSIHPHEPDAEPPRVSDQGTAKAVQPDSPTETEDV